jgi:DNA-binding response OmpR family regulator
MFAETNVVFVDGRLLDLTPEEFVLLERLARSEGETVSKSELGIFLHHGGAKINSETIDLQVLRLMAKLATCSTRRIVRSPNQDGYMLLATSR